MSDAHQLGDAMGEQLALAVGVPELAGPGPAVRWQAPCGAPGPYSIRRPTPKAINRLEVLTCGRPAGHDGDRHVAYDVRSVVIATWGRDGKPFYPQPIKEN